MAWLEIHQSLLNHRKTLEAAESLNLKPVYLLGHIVSLWLWALDNAPTGTLGHIKPQTLARVMDWSDDPQSLLGVLIDVGFLDESSAGLVIHDWWQYAGKLIERREQNVQRMRAKRATSVQNTCIARAQNVHNTCDARAPATQHNSTQHNSTEQNKRATRPRQTRSDDDKSSNGHYSLFVAYCEGLDIKPETIPKPALPRYLKAASGILAAGYTADQVRDCTRDLKQGYYRDKSLGLWQIAEILPQWRPKEVGGNGSIKQRLAEAEDSSLDRFKAFD